jgi:glycosidase
MSDPGGGPPLKLPPNGARYEGESDCGRVTGNNAATWSPAITDWYETVKLNYGYDFTTGLRAFPHASSPDLPIPDTWWKMDAILAHWQEFGVDGFRCDMSHMVPSEFWEWAIARARERGPAVLFIGEAYDDDPMKIGDGFVMHNLLNAGFAAVYDDPSYKALKRIYDGPAWANDLDGALAADHRLLMFSRALRYAENHDEVRLAGGGQWGGVGMNVGRPVSAILFGVSRGPVLLYSGQEVGEPAAGAEGFGGDDARTTIFDYWCMPELAKWVNAHAFDGGRLSPEQRGLRAYYARLLALVGEPAFRDGDFHPLNPANVWNPGFGRLPGEPASGHWLYAFIRHDPAGGQRFLIVANLHPRETLRDVCVQIPEALTRTLRLDAVTHFTERLHVPKSAEAAASLRSLRNGESSITVRAIPPLAAFYFELHHAPQ